MLYRVIVAAIARKCRAFFAEVRSHVAAAEAETKRIEQAAKAEVTKLRNELVSKIASL